MRWQTPEVQTRLFEDAHDRVTHPEFSDVEFIHVRAKTLINRVPAAAGLPFEHTINVYRGCTHGCVFCFARPTHDHLDLSPARDFHRVIVVKVNAVERLRAELAGPRWGGATIAMGTNTDPYQRAEGRYELTRGVIGALAEARNPFSILTRSPLITRDLALLCQAAERAEVSTALSVNTLDPDLARMLEPGAPHPRARLEAIARLREAGLPAGVMLAPILPGVTDSRAHLEPVVAAAIDAGATSVTPIVLHLRPGVREFYLDWITTHRPELLARYEALYAGGSYAPVAERRRVGALVRRLVEAHGGPRPARGRRRRPAAQQVPAANASEQPRLAV